LARICQKNQGDERVPYFASFSVVSMGLLTTILTLVFDWGGICVDSNGVASPAAIWGEWCASGPLLIFITVAMVDKPDLSRMDWFLILSFFVSLFTGFLMIIPQPNSTAIFLLFISCISFCPTLYLPFYLKQYDGSLNEQIEENHEQFSKFSQRFAQRYNISFGLTFVLPLFAVIYIISMFGLINDPVTILSFQILSVVTKGIFAAAVVDIRLDSLRETQRALVEENRASEARRAFLKYIFHEVRTPLNSLSMGIDILNRSNLDSSDKESLQVMQGASDLMCDTLNNLLIMQNIEEGKLVLCPFSVNEVISKLISSFRRTAAEKKLVITKSIAANVPKKVVGDRLRVENIISNLLSNATKFSVDSQTIHLEAKTTSVETLLDGNKKATIFFSVRDDGPGIALENQKNLFSNSVQTRPHELHEGQGSGLGLSICKQLVTLHGGSIGMESENGSGSTFHFSIPFLVYKQPSEEGLIRDNVAHVPPPDSFGEDSMSYEMLLRPSPSSADLNHSDSVDLFENMAEMSFALVVDDVLSNRKMLKTLLKKCGVEADVAENGLQALEMVQSRFCNEYQVVFMDNLMPVVGGVEATRRLRRLGYRNLIVGVTGNVLENDVIEFYRAGADLVLAKPLKMTMLLLIIQHINQKGFRSKLGKILVVVSNRLQWQTLM